MLSPSTNNHSTSDCATQSGINCDTHSPANWANNYHNVMYKFVLEKKLSSLQKCNVSDMNFQADTQVFNDKYICDIIVAFQSSASEAGCISTKHFKPIGV